MASLARLLERNLRNSSTSRHIQQIRLSSTAQKKEDLPEDDEFRVLNLHGNRQPRTALHRRAERHASIVPPRTMKMATDQDWTAVWPGPKTFHPASVPLPIRQGYPKKRVAPPAKEANAELMKIPNFLHLTPPAIKQQCEAIKKFCTPWPKGLETEEKCQQHFPIEVKSTDYCHALPTIRHPEARRVTLTIRLSDLVFDAHAKDKFLRLIGDRYNSETGIVTIVADRCPLRKQNYDYAVYLLTACYHESFVTEPWEASKTEADMEYYHFERNKSKQSIEEILNWGLAKDAPRQQASASLGRSVEQLINDGENEYNLDKYKQEVLQSLGLSAK